jgi:hypothetical protein
LAMDKKDDQCKEQPHRLACGLHQNCMQGQTNEPERTDARLADV